ncbi:MAG TPA: FHA domain-containing protein [Acidimicrobiales bacterium]|nr:FHA domain-containing protein [Acidimicrobiales bacterium]
MPEQLLNLLKLFLLVLLYLFFLRVLRAVWTEVNTPRLADGAAALPAGKQKGRARRSPRPVRSTHPHLKVLEPAGLRGRSYPLDEEITLGRAAGCQVPLEDAYASQVHARVFQRDGHWFVEDLGSTNGTYLNRRRVAGPMVIKKRDRLQIGNTVLELQ